MSEVDHNALAFYISHYMTVIVREHGLQGEEVLQKIIEVVREIYKWVEPETFRGPITVFKTLNGDQNLLPVEGAQTILDLRTLSQDVHDCFALQILSSGRFLLWKGLKPNPLELSGRAVVYEYRDRTERFFANKKEKEVTKVVPSAASAFSVRTFSDLRMALDEYRTKMVRQSSCRVLARAWYDDKRLFFINGPEHFMRDSLTHFLKCSMRGDVEVRPEQNMDESHPVDIKVTWMCNRIAVIEIKWMGKSKGENGKINQQYWPTRVREGAKQLAEYLDMNIQQVPLHVTKGYLVVFDGRRRTVIENTQLISREHGLHYQDEEVDFSPRYHEIRDDFEVPIRMFMEPICQ